MSSLSHVNFDVQDLGDNEEEELDKEDAEREKELHELLSNELPDDLLDDDNISFWSPGHSGSVHGLETPGFKSDQSYRQQHETEPKDNEEQRHGAPLFNQISMLLTRRGEEFIQQFTTDQPTGNVESDQGHPAGSVTPESESRGYHEGNHGFKEDRAGITEDNNVHWQYDYHDSDDPGEYSDDDFVRRYSGTVQYNDENYNPVYSRPGVAPSQDVVNSETDIIDDFKVQYKRGGTAEVSESQHAIIQKQAIMGQASVSPSTMELAQLQILHRARKRKLQEMTNELASKEKDYERQIRVLNHQLALVKGERDGMASSLKHAQEIATNRKKEVDELEGKLQSFDLEKERMNNEKDEIESELEAAKKTIESLHEQLMQLEKSESLSRAREQHENIVMATQKRHAEDVARLKQKLDDVNNSLIWKNEESRRLQDELVEARKEADRVRLDRAETVNRLTKSLEQSQKQNEELLNAGSTQEISQLQRQLSFTKHEKQNLEERCKTFETDLVDLKDQLRIYESITKFGITADTNDGVKRNLEADDWKTPGAPSLQRNFSTEEALAGLQKELEHSLISNRTKRDELQQLRCELEEVKKHLVSKENENERLELLVRKQEMRVLEQEKRIAEFEDASPHMIELDREKELKMLERLVKEQDSKLEQFVKHEEDLKQLNLQLKNQMSEMVREYDADKKTAIEQCRQSCLNFHDQAMNTMKQQLNTEHEEELAKLRDKIGAVTKELDQVKESYVALSEESRWIEKQTRQQCEDEATENIKEMQTKWNEAKSCELLELRQTLALEIERTLETEKATWRQVEEENLKSRIETEIALAKMDWSKDQQKLREEAVESALSLAEKEWLAKYGKTDEKWEKKLDSFKQEWEETKEAEMKLKLEQLQVQVSQEQEEKMNAAHDEWGRLKSLDIEREVERARCNWDQDLVRKIQEAEKSAVEKARADWLKEQENVDPDQTNEKSVAEALIEAKKEWEREKDIQITDYLATEKQKWQSDSDIEKQQAIKTAVSLAEEKWNNEHVNKVNIAVKEALELAEAAWSGERDSAVESAVAQSLRSAKEAWSEDKVKEIEQILSNARKQWVTELSSSRLESDTPPSSRKCTGSSEPDLNKTFSYLEAQYSKNLKEFRETALKQIGDEHERKLRETIQDLETKHETRLAEQQENYQSQLDSVSSKAQEAKETELKELETEFQNRLENIVEEIEEKWREKKAVLEEDWSEKFEKERELLQSAYREKYEKERDGLARQTRERYETARKKLEYQFKERLQNAVERAKHDWEAEQEEDRIAVEEQHAKKLENERERLKKEMKEENELRISQVKNESLEKTRHLEEEAKSAKKQYKVDIENLRKELKEIKQRRSRNNDHTQLAKDVNNKALQVKTDAVPHDQPWISLTEISDETPNYERLNELRRQYLATTAQLKDDLMQHAIETRNNAAKAIRSEVMKERHSTSNQLRKYYLECLKQILDEDKEACEHNQGVKTNEEKLKIMDERLRLPGEKDATMISQDSTFTNVTSFRNITSDITRSDNLFTSTLDYPGKDSPIRTRDHKTSHQQYLPSDVSVGSRPPRIPSAGNRMTKLKHGSEVSNSRGDKYGEDKSPRNLQGKNFRGGDFGSRRLDSSLESFDSIPSSKMDKPPVMEFVQEQISDISRGDASDTSDSSGNYRRQEVHTSDRRRSQEALGKRTDHSRASTLSNKRDTHSNQLDSRETTQNKSKRETRENKWDKRESKRDTRENKHDTRFKEQDTCLIKEFSGNDVPSHVTSSLRKPIGDVLPSKPLSPASHPPDKFSYSLHSRCKTNK